MARKDFTDLKSLFKHIESQASKVLKTDVAPVVVQEMSDTILEEVYPAYESEAKDPYVRRGLSGGLADPHNIQVEIVDDNTLSIKNMTTGNSQNGDRRGWTIDDVIVRGYWYGWGNSEIVNLQPFPRDFYGWTVRRLKKSNAHIYAFKRGMKRLGIKVE